MPKPSPINANSPVVEEPVSGAGNKLFQEFKLVDTLLTLSHSAVSEYLAIYLKNTTFINSWEHSGSVVECLTRDQGAAGCCVVVLEQDTFILA